MRNLFRQGDFQMDPNTTPEMLLKKQERLAAMMPRYGQAKYVGEGLGHLFTGISSGRQNRAMDRFEGEQRAEATAGGQRAMDNFGNPMSILGMTPRDDPNQGLPDEATAALGEPAMGGGDASNAGWLRYSNQGATRNKPLAGNLVSALSFLPEMGVTMNVVSGGQDASGPNRTGSTRHDHGNAADADFYVGDRKLNPNNPEDLPILTEIVRRGRANGLTGFGEGTDYMGAGRLHVGFGNEGVWGADGKSANAPAWLRTAFNGGQPAQPSGGGNLAELMQAAANPWLAPDQRAQINAMIQQAQGEQQTAQSRAFAREESDRERLLDQNDPMRQVQLAQAQFDLEQDRSGTGGGTEYGLTPIYGTDADGNSVLGTLGKDGTFKQLDTGGFDVSTGIEKVDVGNRIALYDKRSGELIGYEEKGGAPSPDQTPTADGGLTPTPGSKLDVEQQALKREKALLNSSTVDRADRVSKQVMELINDPYLPRMLGPIDSRMPNTTEDAARVQGRIDQVRGGAFLEAREMLSGGGQITDFEGKKAEAAMTRINEAMSPADYKRALMDFNDAVQAGARKLRDAGMRSAGTGGTPPTVPQFEDNAAYLRSLGLE